jgi:hypothetical protein
MGTTFQRAPLTAALLTLIATESGFPCGDGIIPEGSGWGASQPNKPGSTFAPYSVLTTLNAVPAPSTGSIGDPQEDWHIPYMLQCFGVARTQAETFADKVRPIMSALRTTIFDLHSNFVAAPNNYKVQDCWVASIGAVNVTPGTDPPYYGQQDQYTLWLAKRRT